MYLLHLFRRTLSVLTLSPLRYPLMEYLHCWLEQLKPIAHFDQSDYRVIIDTLNFMGMKRLRISTHPVKQSLQRPRYPRP